MPKYKIAVFILGMICCGWCPAIAETIITADETVSQQFSAGPKRLIVEMFNGYILISTQAKPAIQAEVIKRGIGATLQEAKADIKNIIVEMKVQGDTLRVTARHLDQRTNRPNSAGLAKIRIPAGMNLELQTSNDKISVIGPVGSMVAETTNGAIETKGAKGPIRGVTSNGLVIIQGGAGRLQLETSNADIQIETSQALVTAITQNAGIRFVGRLAKGKNRFQTENGDIELKLPGDSSLSIDAGTSNGEIRSDFAVTAGERTEDVLKGKIGALVGVMLEMSTMNGSLRILKR